MKSDEILIKTFDQVKNDNFDQVKFDQVIVCQLNELTYEFSDASETDPADDTVKVPSLLFTKVPRNE
jgi:hypothetical protein